MASSSNARLPDPEGSPEGAGGRFPASRSVSAFAFACACCLFPAIAPRAAFDCRLVQGREGGDRIRIVVYAEAYTEPMEEFFHKEVEEALADLFSLSPWREFKDHFVVYSAWAPSAWDYLGPKPSDSTFFHSTFDGAYSHLPYAGVPARIDSDPDFRCRELSREALRESYSVVAVNIPTSMLVTGIYPGNRTVLVSRYGLGGVMGHELGHAIGELSDEYSGTGNGGTAFFDGLPVRRPVYNIAASTDPDKIPWKVWIDPSTPIPTPATSAYDTVVGLFEGADYSLKNRYKPTQHCMMRGVTWMNALPELCPVCREALAYHFLSVPTTADPWLPRPRIRMDTVWPPPGSTVGTGRISARPLETISHPLEVRWRLDGRPLSQVGNTLEVDALDGGGVLEATIAGRNPFLRNAAYLVNDTLRWLVERGAGTQEAGRRVPAVRRVGANLYEVVGDRELPVARDLRGRRLSIAVLERGRGRILLRLESGDGLVFWSPAAGPAGALLN